ncbi:conserved Plasmodium protein, unknown function [Plasmodium knowlesi strain H]|uniref:FMR1-interacting protein 1 conserved domain-containing protein n=3 Tax=Plasmodium knowlesi TaxID=5850 RepID=A0A5K1VHV7_PLAKH|nr:conserved Plasmodium protein, unknown function [Plasmodium knowlesi strain H]OTN65708.1 Uncharacterized protein PKNOH_S110077700 [Plasmodium knowlesi]CAA9989398.1 conserved Plasmodium protein, unknown function [Plasmodium knowlesi strain H]SBO24997.1 conserved Plasmodium protein, unknown function [Plasmodium knowlesi strain H]SBO27874.1 conserved Plasmodium protein, unknown function [Plasmodium knowlesi strain H]VVS78872.1 conserved Plasmodium protein, unknown function [Plasmodium knowlesi |eukprot:XP_002260125.1 hypothetical protein, conserved in Plasmodium species [Plasmodium knowlesi strain H]
MGAQMGEKMSQDEGNNNYKGHIRAMKGQGDVWFATEKGTVPNMQGQSRLEQSSQVPKWASTAYGHSPNWPMQNRGASYWRPRGSFHNNRIGRHPWGEAPGAQNQNMLSNNRWRAHHAEVGCQREQRAHGPLAPPDGNYLKNYFSSYGNGYVDDGSGDGSCGYHYPGAPQQDSERENARPYNGGRGGASRTVGSSGPSRTIHPPPPSDYAKPRVMYHSGYPQMGSKNGDDEDMEDPYQGSTNMVDNANSADGNHWISHTMDNSYESRNCPPGEFPMMGGLYNFRKGNDGVGFPSTNSFVAPPHRNRGMRGGTHWKKWTEERNAQKCSSVKKHGGKKRQKVDFPLISESKNVEIDPKKGNRADDGDDQVGDNNDGHGGDDNDTNEEDDDDDGDGVGPKGINVQMEKSKENNKFIFCHYCDVNIEAGKLEEHNQSEHIKCPIDNCGQIYSIDDLDVHLLNHIKNDKDEVILNDSKEIEKWIQERKKNYPTREKIAINKENSENGKKKKKKKPNCLIEELLFESYCSAVGRNIYFNNKWEKSIFVPLLTKLEQNGLHNIYENSYYPLFNNSMGKFYPANMRRRPFKQRQLIDTLNIHRKSPLLYQLMKKEIYLYEKKLIKCIEFITRSDFFDDTEGGAAGTDILELG